MFGFRTFLIYDFRYMTFRQPHHLRYILRSTPYPLQRRRSRQEFPCSPFEDYIYSGNQPLIPFDPPVSFILEFEQHVCEPFRVFRGPGPLHPFPKLRGGYGFSIFTESLLEFGTQEPVYFALVDCPAMLKEFNA